MSKKQFFFIIIFLNQVVVIQTAQSQQEVKWRTAPEVYLGYNLMPVNPTFRQDTKWFHFIGKPSLEYKFELYVNSSDEFQLNQEENGQTTMIMNIIEVKTIPGVDPLKNLDFAWNQSFDRFADSLNT